jgi:hypothetical protein
VYLEFPEPPVFLGYLGYLEYQLLEYPVFPEYLENQLLLIPEVPEVLVYLELPLVLIRLIQAR